jgi:hypothetical protein
MACPTIRATTRLMHRNKRQNYLITASARPRPLGELCPEGQRASSTTALPDSDMLIDRAGMFCCDRHRGELRHATAPLPECDGRHCRLQRRRALLPRERVPTISGLNPSALTA